MLIVLPRLSFNVREVNDVPDRWAAGTACCGTAWGARCGGRKGSHRGAFLGGQSGLPPLSRRSRRVLLPLVLCGMRWVVHLGPQMLHQAMRVVAFPLTVFTDAVSVHQSAYPMLRIALPVQRLLGSVSARPGGDMRRGGIGRCIVRGSRRLRGDGEPFGSQPWAAHLFQPLLHLSTHSSRGGATSLHLFCGPNWNRGPLHRLVFVRVGAAFLRAVVFTVGSGIRRGRGARLLVPAGRGFCRYVAGATADGHSFRIP